MAELAIGAHCAHPDCHQLDFLPIQCDRCKFIFCKLHSSMIAHACVSDQDATSSQRVRSDGLDIAASCQIESCAQREMVPFICEACGGTFCVKHKQKETHQCRNLWTATDEARAERQAGLEASSKLDRSNLEAVSLPLHKSKESVHSNKPKSDRARATAAKLTLMKAKMSAQPAGRSASSLPEEQRFILRLVPATDLECASCDSPLPLYFGKKWPLGKLLDYGKERFSIKCSPGQSIGLVVVEDEILPDIPPESASLELSRTLDEYHCEGRLVEGCLLRIVAR